MKFGIKRMSEKIALPDPIHSGRRNGVAGSFKFDENV